MSIPKSESSGINEICSLGFNNDSSALADVRFIANVVPPRNHESNELPQKLFSKSIIKNLSCLQCVEKQQNNTGDDDGYSGRTLQQDSAAQMDNSYVMINATRNPPCGHRGLWKRLRSKGGYAYFTCLVCDIKWRNRALGPPKRVSVRRQAIHQKQQRDPASSHEVSCEGADTLKVTEDFRHQNSALEDNSSKDGWVLDRACNSTEAKLNSEPTPLSHAFCKRVWDSKVCLLW
jgi:hypothetical protein